MEEIGNFMAVRGPGENDSLQFSSVQPNDNDLQYLIVRGSLRRVERGEYTATLAMAPQYTTTFSFDVGFDGTVSMTVADLNEENIFHSWLATITRRAREQFEDYARHGVQNVPEPPRVAPVAQPPLRIPRNIADLPRVRIPRGQEAMISFDEINNGAVMVDFHNERDQFHRYFLLNDFARLPRMISPATNRPVVQADITYYVAELDDTMQPHPVIGGRRSNRKSRKARRTRRMRRTRRNRKEKTRPSLSNQGVPTNWEARLD
jgi:hypothetical protein